MSETESNRPPYHHYMKIEPSDDERGVIAQVILPLFDELVAAVYGDGPYSGAESALDAADLLIAAGFHRTVRGEPSDAVLGIMAQRFYEASGLNIPHTSKPEVVTGLRAALRAAAAVQGGETPRLGKELVQLDQDESGNPVYGYTPSHTWSCDHGCTEPSAACILDHKPSPA